MGDMGHMDHGAMGDMDHGDMDHGDMMMTTGMGTMDPGSHGSGEHMCMHDMMKMYFHTSVSATILFEKWAVSSVGGMIGSCIAVFVMALLYEGFKVLRESLLRQSAVNVRYQSTEISKSSTSVLTETHRAGSSSRFLSWGHILQTFLHIIQVTISYFLMLIFMTYNVYLCISVAIGAGVGYFLFGWKRSIIVDLNEHCH